MINNDKARIIASAVSATLGACLFVYLWKEVGDKGIYADETGTSGAITAYEYTLAFLMLVCIVISVFLFSKTKKADVTIKKKLQYYILSIIFLVFMACAFISFSSS